ncbi:hypothetical protein AAB992_28135 [Burkholderia contaminans]|uniref:hypothetical protein n=1 Tax=Burkholderia contaminans TaxID=488447 RepID=UPI0024179976|nr:hypothetical protein [Burkholderia contaminans]WFN13164.1 hypothetical protein LXE92_19560 [Burkholderia contaminans]
MRRFYVAIPSRSPAEILVPVDHPIRACRRSPLTGAEEKATYHIRNISEWRFIRVFNALPERIRARPCRCAGLRSRSNIRRGRHARIRPDGNLKNETWRICRARAGLIGKPLNANGKGLCASRTPRYRADRHVSALKHESRASAARGRPCRVKNPTVSLYAGRLEAWHRRCVLSSGLARSAKPFLVTSGGFHA